MTIVLNASPNMNESLRSAYLDSMGITCWIPKDSDDEISSIEAESIEAKSIETEQVKIEPVTTEQVKTDQVKTIQTMDKRLPAANEETQLLSTETEAINESKILTNNQYLKLINWQNQIIKEEGNKQLLIICRHQIDQPASSFATATSPSRFMQDYINSLISLLDEEPFDLKIQMAHLSQAGLGQDTINMDEHIEKSKPNLILLLGEESVSQLLGEESKLAELRGQIISYENQQKLLVSYHPFSLIENPSLKALALDDLRYLAHYLSLNT